MLYEFDIELFMKVNNMRQIDAAKYFDCEQSFISQIKSGKSKIPDDYISKILVDENIDKSMLVMKGNNPQPGEIVAFISYLRERDIVRDKELHEKELEIRSLIEQKARLEEQLANAKKGDVGDNVICAAASGLG